MITVSCGLPRNRTEVDFLIVKDIHHAIFCLEFAINGATPSHRILRP